MVQVSVCLARDGDGNPHRIVNSFPLEAAQWEFLINETRGTVALHQSLLIGANAEGAFPGYSVLSLLHTYCANGILLCLLSENYPEVSLQCQKLFFHRFSYLPFSSS